jgi:putative endonuclease
VEQLVARWAHNPKVVSSSLAPATEQKGLQLKTFLHFTRTTSIIMFVTYALYSEKFDKLYIEFTQDLISRFHSHNSLAKSGYTVKYRPWKVIYVDFFETKLAAIHREKELKSNRGRMFLRDLIK